MPARVEVCGWEGWCRECSNGSGATDRDAARAWARKHNRRSHLRRKKVAA